jgi:hypothetical protein
MVRLTKEQKKLVKKLENAYVVCSDCGSQYGVYSVGCSSVWNAKCDVCEEEKPVTEARDYAYLVTGIRKIMRGGLKSLTSESDQSCAAP